MTFSRRPKKCAICKSPFQPRSMTHKACKPECAIELARIEREKKERKEARLNARRAAEEKREHRAKVEKLKTRSDWIKEAQSAFNAFVRYRDRGLSCISCGTSLRQEAVGGGYDCGHYRSVGSAPHLRFDERNAHGQCKRCNRYGSGMAVDYRHYLKFRIGLDALDALEQDQTPKHYSIDDLKSIKAHYRQKLKELQK